ncbi:type II toxin-antitoxin system PemK/MazF family toxin [Thiovibrio sp. JS02]
MRDGRCSRKKAWPKFGTTTKTRPGMMFAYGDIILVAFPFSEGKSSKRRPAVVLRQPDDFGDFLALPVTSRSFHENAVAIDPSMLAKGALPKASWIRCDKIATLHSSQVLAVLQPLRPFPLQAS